MRPEHIPLPWQRTQWLGLVELAAADRLPHALLLAGPSGTGKGAFAGRFAQLQLCAAVDVQPCGTCRHCQLIAAGSHPNLVAIRPQEPSRAILIEAVRALREFCAARPHQRGWRVILIEPAEALNHNAANALLKTLEEPGEQTLLLLVSHQPALLPATIRSRCRMLRFPEPDLQTALAWLREQLPDAEDIESLLRDAGGRPLGAIALADGSQAAQVAQLRQLAEAVASGSMGPADAAPEAAALDWDVVSQGFAVLLRERLRAHIATDGRLPQGVFRCFDELVRAHRERAANANLSPELVWDRLWSAWRQAAAGSG